MSKTHRKIRHDANRKAKKSKMNKRDAEHRKSKKHRKNNEEIDRDSLKI